MEEVEKPVSRRVRFEVLRRDKSTCRYCGATAPEAVLTVDHVIPRALGGTNDPSNLVAACRDCNTGKTSTSPDEHVVAEVNEAAVRWAKAMEVAAEARRAQFAEVDEQVRRVADVWDGFGYGTGEGRQPVQRDGNWKKSLETFLSAGLNADDLGRLIRVAMGSKVASGSEWRYFCGCCWTEITRRQQMALAMLDGVGGAQAATDGGEPPTTPEFDAGYSDGFDDGYAYAKSRIDEQESASRFEEQESAEEAFGRGFRQGAARAADYEARDHDEPDEW